MWLLAIITSPIFRSNLIVFPLFNKKMNSFWTKSVYLLRWRKNSVMKQYRLFVDRIIWFLLFFFWRGSFFICLFYSAYSLSHNTITIQDISLLIKYKKNNYIVTLKEFIISIVSRKKHTKNFFSQDFQHFSIYDVLSKYLSNS